jgi:pimeloyl-ACP methyl ester carboxylesterase
VGAAAALASVSTFGLTSTVAASQVEGLPVPVEVVPLPPQAPVTEGLLDAAGARLWYWDTGGKGEPTVLLHPATGSGATWGYQQPVLAKAGYRVIGYSRRGHFRSIITDADVDASDLEDLRALIGQLGLTRFHLIGSAAGSFLAAQYAVTYPQHLATLVLSSSLIGIQDKDYQDLIGRVVPPSFAMLPPEFRELGPSYRTANPEGTAQWITLEKTARLAGPSAPRPTSVGRDIVTFENLAALKVPMLLLTGDCDLYACPALLVYIARRLGRSAIAVIENAGHAAFWEQPEAYNKTVRDFLEQHRYQPS